MSPALARMSRNASWAAIDGGGADERCCRAGRSTKRNQGRINPAVTRPTAWWLDVLRRRAATMYSEPTDKLRIPVEFTSEAEQRACIAFFNAAYRAEESGLSQAHRLAAQIQPRDP